MATGRQVVKLIPYGMRTLDDVLGGAPIGHLSIIGGEPGNGKSALAVSLAVNAARSFGGAHVFPSGLSPRSKSCR